MKVSNESEFSTSKENSCPVLRFVRMKSCAELVVRKCKDDVLNFLTFTLTAWEKFSSFSCGKFLKNTAFLYQTNCWCRVAVNYWPTISPGLFGTVVGDREFKLRISFKRDMHILSIILTGMCLK